MRNTISILLAGCVLLALQTSAPAALAQPDLRYDLIIANGRVMDPQTGTDRIATVGIRAGKIAAISDRQLQGARTIDAKGLVVAPASSTFIPMLNMLSAMTSRHRTASQLHWSWKRGSIPSHPSMPFAKAGPASILAPASGCKVSG